MSVKIKNEDIFNCTEDIIVHQVNCQGVMGAGIAREIRRKYPKAFTEYKNICATHKPEDLLGCYQSVGCNNKIICNLFGQLTYGSDKKKVYTSYAAFKTSLTAIRDLAKKHNFTIAIPYGIGCGLANGSWDIVYNLICDIFQDYDIVIYRKGKNNNSKRTSNTNTEYDVSPISITSFRGEYGFLSNMHCQHMFKYEDAFFTSVESAFQSQKDPSKVDYFVNLNPVDAKRLGNKLQLRSDWEKVKDGIMYDIVYAKFSQNPYLKNKLLETSNKQLVEVNSYNDNYWGVTFDINSNKYIGLNKLGEILMKVRDELSI